MLKIHLIAAARPNFMKVGPLFHALRSTSWASPVLVHTGQHYDHLMSDAIMHDLDLPSPDFNLGVGSGTHAEQTGRVMIAYDAACEADKPDWIVVVGDVNSTAACAMVGVKRGIPVVHLEAGLRSRDRSMPEEINRLITDSISDVLWTPSEDADANLAAEGIDARKIDRVGNIMMDSLESLRDRIESADMPTRLNVRRSEFILATLHRPSNVDHEATLRTVVRSLVEVASKVDVVFAAHPRTMKNLKAFGLLDALRASHGVHVVEPVPYIQFMNLVFNSLLVVTDSGGLQEETTYLGKPCLTLRENTERPITISMGTNQLVNPATLPSAVDCIMRGDWKQGEIPPLWDGKSAGRAVECLRRRAGMPAE